MSEVSDRYRRIADGFAARLTGVEASQWSSPTPCTDWTVRDLVVHVVRTHHAVYGRVSGADAAEVDADGDLLAQFRAVSAEVGAALDDPERAATIVGGMFREQPFERLVSGLLCSDTLVHTWDLARATGQDERMDPDGVAKSTEFLATIDEPMRRPGGFAPKIEPAADADAQTRWLNFCGRAV